jgi:hypothetical protein
MFWAVRKVTCHTISVENYLGSLAYSTILLLRIHELDFS